MKRRILLAAPFLVLPLFARLAVGPIGDSIASAAARSAPRPAKADEAVVDSDEPLPPAQKAGGPSLKKTGPVIVRRASDAGAPDAGARATIVVPAAVVARAIGDKMIFAQNAVDDDAKPVGCRIFGVNRYGTGLQTGDVIVSVAGSPTPTISELVATTLKMVAAGATRISGKILRDGALWDVVLEVPPPPKTN